MREIFFKGPVPGIEGGQFCAVCSMIFKAQVMEASAEVMQFAMRAEGAEPFWVDMSEVAAKKGIKLPWLAVMTGPSQLLGNMSVPLCWSHVTGLTIKNGMVMPAGPGDMAAVTGQPVPMLGRR